MDQDPPGEDPGFDSEATEVQSHRMEQVTVPRSPASRTSIAGVSETDLNLSVQMVQAFIRRQEYRGSDVRLDVGTLYRPDACPRATVNPHCWLWHEAHSYPSRVEEHINILELRAPDPHGGMEAQKDGVQWSAIFALVRLPGGPQCSSQGAIK